MARPKRLNRPPSILDVAAAAGVSHQTVSRVLNNSKNVLPQTRERVQAAIDELGYRRNSAARALARHKSEMIGVITTTSLDYGPSSILMEVELAARASGYYTAVAPIEDYDDSSIEEALDHLLGLPVEGLVVIAPLRDVAADMSKKDIPVPVVAVTTQEMGEVAGVIPVAIDQVKGARLALEHLYGLGHRDIAHIAGQAEFFEARHREATWRAFMGERALAIREPVARGWDFSIGYEEGRRLLAEGMPSAVFCANDQIALGLYRALEEAGRSVPSDVSIVGFDDMPAARYYSPALTTINQDFASLGRLVLSTLLEAIDAPEAAGIAPKSLEPVLVVRDSTARP
ncbi:LacI family transcriptional regulator [Actinomyces sp. B33]|uniref:LacI family DNA-binding transcriptional regulator n=1 Tax=Actinomyces sp. B33 TaxID=2942131 RepID=UPI0023401343|nr:LacI family DNA-binding transcriptional regulator [Actinomyces sp. B33]MDC4233831.1 LacI family transcriptional regulator [Actinomyces sp. B33]